AERAQVSSHEGRRQATTAGIATGTSRWLRGVEEWLNNRTIAYGTATLSLGAFALAVMLNFLGHSDLPAAQERPAGPVTQKKIPIPEKAAAAATGNPRPDKKHATAKAPAAGPVDNNAESVARTKEQPVEEKKESKAGPFSFLAKREEPAAEPAPPPSVGTAIITLAVAPWGEVFVDGDRVGVSPPVNEIEVAPGKRIVEIRNSNFPVFSQVVEVKADQKVRIKHKFN
ncbi:MAG TPA: PEGA domain-containing protein, partial [Burkholderiales bacterium]